MANMAEKRLRQEEARRTMRIPEGAPPPMGPDERVPGAPVLSLTLECAPTVARNEDFAVTIRVTYSGEVSGGASETTTPPRPVTFRSWSILALHDSLREGFWLYRHRRGNHDSESEGDELWEVCDLDDGDMGFNIYDEPDVAVRVVENKDFTTLRPGESWTTSIFLQRPLWSLLPSDTVPGDRFLYGFKGAVVDWWDWGGADEHANTVVMLPCWIAGRVVDPGDNGGRPKLVVPYAEPVEFKIVE